jgi:hypothetical protein
MGGDAGDGGGGTGWRRRCSGLGLSDVSTTLCRDARARSWEDELPLGFDFFIRQAARTVVSGEAPGLPNILPFAKVCACVSKRWLSWTNRNSSNKAS